MLKKVLAGTFVALMIGAIVFGAVQLVNRTSDSGDQVHARAGWEGRAQQAALNSGQSGSQGGQAAVSGRGRGQGAWSEEDAQAGRGRGQQTTPQGNGQSGRDGQGAGQSAPNTEDAPLAQEVTTETLEGIVVETVELTIDTGEQTVQVGLGPSFYREDQGFVLQVGERVQVSGFYEDGEFKAQQVVKLATGESITLRDDYGRPMWAGRGRGGS